MLASLSEYKFFQAFRIPVHQEDQVRCMVERELSPNRYEYLEDAKLVDVSLSGIGLNAGVSLEVGQVLRFSLHFRKVAVEMEGEVVRVLEGETEGKNLYGVNLEDSEELMQRFLRQYIYSLGPERLRDCVEALCLSDRYDRSHEGVELFTLLVSLFQDIGRFATRKGFMELILRESAGILQAQRATAYLIHPESNELRSVASLGTEAEEIRLDYRQGIAGSVFTTGCALNIESIQDKASKLRFAIGPDTKSVVCCPIHNADDKVVGVLEMVNKQKEQRFSHADEELMHVLSLIFGVIFARYNSISEQSRVRSFSTPFDREYAIIGGSAAVQEMRKAIVRFKDVDGPVLIQGEEGVGKMLLAQVIHYEGRRGGQPWEVVDCRYLRKEELEYKLFGQDNLLSRMRGGSLIFKHCQQLPPCLQDQLLAILKSGALPGSDLALDLRPLFTSSEDLERKVMEGGFNSQLFEHISKMFVQLPSLRERLEDIPGLVNYFLKLECREQGMLLKAFSAPLLERLEEHFWPGNVLELRRLVARAVVLNPKNHIITELSELTAPRIKRGLQGLKLFEDIPYAATAGLKLKDRLALIERSVIESEIKRCKGNKSQSAKAMGISREALRKKLLQSDKVLEELRRQQSQQSSPLIPSKFKRAA